MNSCILSNSFGAMWHPVILGQAAKMRQSFQLMISGLRLFAKQRSTESRVLASAFDRRHRVRPKNMGRTQLLVLNRQCRKVS